MELLKKFNNTSRFIDDLATLNNDGYLQQFKERIYPKELVLNQENKEDTRATFLDHEAHIKMGNSTLRPMTNKKHSISKSSTILISLGTYPNDQPIAYTSPKLYVMPRHVTKPRISPTESDYSSTDCARNISPKNGCWQPWRNAAGRTTGLWKNIAMGWTIIWPMIVGALIHEAGTVIQALKPVCQFMAEEIPPPVLNQLVIRYLVNLLVRIKEPSSPTGWQQSPQPQTEDTKKSRKLDCVATGFIYDDKVNFTVDVCPSVCHCFFTLFPSSYHPQFFRSSYHWQTWCPCKRSRSQRSWPHIAVSGL